MIAPTDIEEFRLVRTLGRGGMGTVYLAHDSILDRPVALKIMTGVSEDSRLRFLTEARAIARLHHPNVVAIHRAGTTASGEPYLVQELIRGQPLDRVPLPVAPRRCLALATGIARGLAAAHRRGVLHRDVKPSNIMIDDDGTPRLLDFGIAKLSEAPAPPVPAPSLPAASGHPIDETAELPGPGRDGRTDRQAAARPPATQADEPSDPSPNPTRPGAILGTPRYMAPEVWCGEVATARADLYALGVVMYELLAGEPPFAEHDHAALREAVLRGPARPIDERVAELDPEFAALIARCLARDPAARPESADEVVDRLERIASGAAAIPDGNPYRGLLPFEAEQRAVFFGRGSEIAAVVDRARGDPFVVVAGDSGIGKSSLCRAGVLPAIIAGALGDGRSWTTRTVTLGRHPIATLAELLGMELAPGLLSESTEASQLASRIGRHLALGPGRGLLAFVDQLEELVTQAPPADATMAAAILAALGDGIPGVKVIAAVRGDFLTRVAALPGLRGVMTRSLHLVRGLSPDDARDVVVAPARAKGVTFETREMIDELARAIGDRPAALPLLSFALAELWVRRDLDRAIIPARALDEIGGVVGALASHADRVLTSLEAPARKAARRILLALVTADGTRAARARAELVADDPAAALVLEALVSGRLIAARDVADGAPVYELAHESLLVAWGTLRGWLDDAAGQRGIRTRLQTAASEWTRLGKRRDLLWRRSQLAETAQLEQLAAADQAFLAASRRAARLRIVVTTAIAAAIPAAAGLTWLGIAMRDEARRERQVVGQLADADRRVQVAEASVRDARRVRSAAITRFEDGDHDDDDAEGEEGEARRREAEARRREAEARWREAMALFGTARAALRDATTELETALLASGNLARVRRAMAGAIYRHAVIAEEVGDQAAVAELEQRLASYDDGSYLVRWRAAMPVVIASGSATHIEVSPYVDHLDGARVLAPPVAAVEGDHLVAALPRGSYLARVQAPGIAPVVLPFMVERGAPVELEVALPRPGQVPEGMIYIPPGAFLIGSRDETSFRTVYQHASPLYRTTTRGYLISRTEVTFEDWLAYLRALPAAEREAHRQSSPPGAQRSVRLELDAFARFTLVLQPTSEAYSAREGQPIIYPGRTLRSKVRWEQLPVSGVSYEDAVAYAAWLAATGRVPHARLCSEAEWERAARGADARNFPHGDRLLPDDADFDQTYGKKDTAYGPDPVGSHPASDSPFGVVDLAGNAFEWVVAGRRPKVRGGSWLQGPTTVTIANHSDMNRRSHDAFLGIRICADL